MLKYFAVAAFSPSPGGEPKLAIAPLGEDQKPRRVAKLVDPYNGSVVVSGNDNPEIVINSAMVGQQWGYSEDRVIHHDDVDSLLAMLRSAKEPSFSGVE